MKKLLKKIGSTLGIILFLVLVGFAIWSSFPAGPGDTAYTSLESNPQVQVVQMAGWLFFTPIGEEPEEGFIFYPGGDVDYRSYSPILWKIAQAGYVVVVPDMPFNLAVLAPNKANKIMESYPQISCWVIGGHSLGGTMAAHYAYQNPGKVCGLVLWAAYPAKGDDLSSSNLEVTSIYATNDGLTTKTNIEASRALLPASTTWVEIQGGNHAQFGDYGKQNGDFGATITAADQWKQVISATLNALE
ncbi:MAG: alpha/beta hydrolase [Anaerolineaceae bacterium]